MRRAWRSTCDVAPGTSRYSCSHRVAWVKASGPIPPGKNVCHHCDVSRCKNDRHLFLATQAENLRDMDSKDRRRSRSVPRFGENNPGNKLTVKDVRAIRKASARGVKDAAQAKKYGVAKTAIGAILLGRTWKGVV